MADAPSTATTTSTSAESALNTHLPPSLPSSPLPKRTKTMADASPSPNSANTNKPLPHAPLLQSNPTATSLLSQDAILSAAVPLQVKLLKPEATPPTRGSKFSAGYDLYVCEDGVVPARGKAMLSTGVSIAVPPGTYARVAPRSGLAVKHSIQTGAGVIDYDYRGEVKLLLFNHSDVDFDVKAGDRMAQMVLERIVNPDVVVVEELEGTERGSGGFGSTGGFGAALQPAVNGS